MIEALFLQLGVPERETRIFLALAELGKSSASVLAKHHGLPRSTVYSLLEQLMQKGLVSREQHEDTSYFLAHSPETLREIFHDEQRKEEKNLQARERCVEQLLPELTKHFRGKHFHIPKISFYETEKAVRAMLYEHEALWQKSIVCYDSVWWGYQDHYFVEHYFDWLEHYWATRTKNEKVCLFSNQSSIEKKLKGKIQNRTIKLLPKKFHFSSTVWVLGDYVITISTRQKPHTAFQLHDPVSAANQRMLFQMMWEEVR